MANSVSSIRNGKPIINKREVVQSIYNNNNGDETYEEHRFEDDNSNVYNSNSHRDVIEMLNNHNLNDHLDNEEMPKIGFDEVDEINVPQTNKNSVSLGKLSNLNGSRRIETKSTVRSTSVANNVSNIIFASIL